MKMNGNDCLLLLFYLLIAVNISPHTCTPRRNNRCTAISVPNGKMTVRHRGRVGRFFCNTGYKLIGDKIATCHGGVWDTVAHCVKDIECPEQMPKVMNGKMVLFNYVFFKVVCNPGFTVPYEVQSIFPCEDFYDPDVKPPVCQLTDEQFCDFETDMCKWNNTVTYFSWIRYQNATPSHSLRTGPEGDHTYGTGHYLYIEASGLPSNEERFAKLVRRFWKVDTPEVCFVFWYHMYGFNIGTLDVYVDYVKVFTKNGNLGDKWQKGIVQNLPSDRDFYISMVATTGNGYAGDIAIDDIGLVNSTDCTKIFLIETSCKDRCFEVETNSTLCKCSSECLIEANCCPDFMQTCGVDAPISTTSSELSQSTYETYQTVSQDVNYSGTMSSYPLVTDLSSTSYTNTVVEIGSTSDEPNLSTADRVSSQNPSDSVSEGTVYGDGPEGTTDWVITNTQAPKPISEQASTNSSGMEIKPAGRANLSESSLPPTALQSPDSTPIVPERRAIGTSEDEFSTSEVYISTRSSEVDSSPTSPMASGESVTMKIKQEVSSIKESTSRSSTMKCSSRVSDLTSRPPTPSSASTSKVSTTSKVPKTKVLTTSKHLTSKSPTPSSALTYKVPITSNVWITKVLTTSTSPVTKKVTPSTTELSDGLTMTTHHPTEPKPHPQNPETNKSSMEVTFQVTPSLEVTTVTGQIRNMNSTVHHSEFPIVNASNDGDQDVDESTDPNMFTVGVLEGFSTLNSGNNAKNNNKDPLYTRRKTYVPKGRYTFSAVKSESKTTTYISLVAGILIFLSAAFFAGYVFRRRRSHLFRGSTEESDVLFMTSDEILDFNVARRPTASGTAAPGSSQQLLCQTEY